MNDQDIAFSSTPIGSQIAVLRIGSTRPLSKMVATIARNSGCHWAGTPCRHRTGQSHCIGFAAMANGRSSRWVDADRSAQMSQFVTSVSSRQMLMHGGQAVDCRQNKNGSMPCVARSAHRMLICWAIGLIHCWVQEEPFILRPTKVTQKAASSSMRSAICGSGPAVNTPRSPAINHQEVRWANTMESSCATSCASRRIVCDSVWPHPNDVSQLLSAERTLAVHLNSTREVARTDEQTNNSNATSLARPS